MARGDTVEQVRLLAAERGVSERTVWRWFAAMHAADSDELLTREPVCDACGEPLPAGTTIRRRFCDGACRVYQHRDGARRRALAIQHEQRRGAASGSERATR
jgi:hypothetical protein